jgi:hypothetical protein
MEEGLFNDLTCKATAALEGGLVPNLDPEAGFFGRTKNSSQRHVCVGAMSLQGTSDQRQSRR